MAHIVCVGGGTLGSVTPLLALTSALRRRHHELVWIGTYTGPERDVVQEQNIPFFAIIAPKLRRYFSWRHILMPIEWCAAILQSFFLLARLRPAVILSAGGFVAVPVVWVGRCFGIPSIIHQQDADIGLANRLSFPAARVVTTVFDEQRARIRHSRVIWTGNLVRDLTPTTTRFRWSEPTVLIFGGGTGAAGINALVSASVCEHAQVIHVTGKGKSGASISHPRYHEFALLTEEMKEALTIADLVVCRAGLGTLSELAYLRKAAIIIPLPQTHQEQNVLSIQKNDAALVLAQETLTQDKLTAQVNRLLSHAALRRAYGERLAQTIPTCAPEQYIAVIESVLTSSSHT